jgi:MoxR-like ATPase|tara:strand:- start:566 stop:1618 length:1053 start_codon:yes stop_codon:yes gene_type:complete
MAVDFKTFIELAPTVSEARFPVLMRGRHGIGKSQVVYQIAEVVKLPVVERRASQMTEGDLVGLPVIKGNTTGWNPPDWFKFACDNPCVLFFDEVDRATVEVRQGLFELTDSRKLNGWKLHKDTLIYAAINGGEHGSNYQVADMDPAELDRYSCWDLEPTVEDWLVWAKERVNTVIWDFINQNPKHLEHNDDVEPNKVYPSRRSWDRLNQTLCKANLVEEASPALFTLAGAFVGFEAAVSFNDFVQNYDRQVTTDDLLDGKAWDKIEKFQINDHNAMIEKLEATDVFKDELATDRVGNLAEYFVNLPSECAMSLWMKMGKGNNKNVIAMHKCKTTKGSVKDYMVTILTGKE